jgi:uncharacterized protein (DUF1015 family)
MRKTRVFGNPVGLGHRPNVRIAATIAGQLGRDPDWAITTIDGVTHEHWLIEGEKAGDLCAEFEDVLYVTDGHHRLAAAARVAAEEGRADAHLPAGFFSADELRLRSFARCILRPTNDVDAIIRRLEAEHHLTEVDDTAARPRQRGEFGVGIADRRFLMRLGAEELPGDPYESLDVNLLQKLVLEPVFGIADMRGDKRLRFVADLSDTSHLDLDAQIWFLPFPAAVDEVMAVADSGRVMPPKSTLFTPKLPAGLVIRLVDEP